MRTSLLLPAFASLFFTVAATAADWPQFRGPDGNASSDDPNVPLTWSDSQNLKWTLPLPGLGSSGPIVTGGKVIVTCFSGEKGNGDVSELVRHILCVDKATVKLLWQKDLPATNQEDAYQGMITEHGYATSTPVTDGKQIFVHLGKSGVVALDMTGKELWRAETGKESSMKRWGSGGSPILWKNLVIVNACDEAQSLIAFDKTTGKQAWKQTADLLDLSFGTPHILKRHDGREDLLFAVPGELWGMNPETGKLRWYAETGLTGNISPDPVVAGDTLCVFGGFPSTGRVGIQLSDDGKSHTAWEGTNASYIPTPVAHGGYLFWVSDQGFANCIEAATGKEIYKERANGGAQGRGKGKPFYASAVAIGDKIYAVSRRQGTFVFAAKPEFQVLATNVIASDNTDFNATPAVSDGCLYLRSNQALYCVGK